MKLSDPASEQIALPLKMGGQGFSALKPLIDALYAASLVDSAKLCIPHPSLPLSKLYFRCARPLLKTFVDIRLPFAQPPTSTTTQHGRLVGTFGTGNASFTSWTLHKNDYVWCTTHRHLNGSAKNTAHAGPARTFPR